MRLARGAVMLVLIPARVRRGGRVLAVAGGVYLTGVDRVDAGAHVLGRFGRRHAGAAVFFVLQVVLGALFARYRGGGFA
jgi:hypothetical protein